MVRFFISYSRADRQFIEQFAPLIKKVYGNDSTWFDDDIHGGADWWALILREIAKSDIFIYLISNESLTSTYCQAELREALRLNKQILPVLVRRLAPSYPGKIAPDLGEVLRRTHYVDMSGGFANPNTIASLYAALSRLSNDIVRASTPQQPTPTPQPIVPKRDAPDPAVRAAYIAGGFAILTAVIIGLFGLWQGVFANRDSEITPTLVAESTALQDPTDKPSIDEEVARATGAAQAYATLTALAPTETPTITPTPTETPISSSDIQQTAQAEIFASETAAVPTRTALAQQTQSVVLTQQFIAGATVTHIAQLSLTPPSPTPTPDPVQAAFVPVARNPDWSPVERDFNGTTMVLVPAGSFVMGSTAEEIEAALALCNQIDRDSNCSRDWFADEARNGDNTQTFGEPFWLDQYEVTRRQYQACVDAGVCSAPPTSEFSTEPEQPINRVTWFEAQAYCTWSGGRLPTEAEWEYAARGPDGLQYPWGNSSVVDEANHCDGNCAEASWASGYRFTSPENDDGHAVTAPVGRYPSGISWVGAHDMAGNVWEWTSSLYEPYPYVSDDGRERDTGDSTDVFRVLRGSSFNDSTHLLRASNRIRNTPNYVNNLTGFRCARSQR
jgi:formylglycine-generating enzyme required for sulfatase activity